MTCKVTVCTPGDIKYERKSGYLVFVNVALLRNIQTVQELYHIKSANYFHKSITPHTVFSSSLRNYCVLTFRISLFRTLQICWISAALWETFSSELPDNCSSSFWFFDASTSTPGCMMTFLTIFSPMKFLHSVSPPFPLPSTQNRSYNPSRI